MIINGKIRIGNEKKMVDIFFRCKIATPSFFRGPFAIKYVVTQFHLKAMSRLAEKSFLARTKL
jgi:hypothetical protein